MIARRLSQFFGLALAVLTTFVAIWTSGEIDPEFVGIIFATFALIVAVLFVILFVALRYATAGSIVFWSGGWRPAQVRWIAIMLGLALAIHLAGNALLALRGSLFYHYENIIYFVAWAGVPIAFVALGLVKWPDRMASASKLRICIVGGSSIAIAVASSWRRFEQVPAEIEVFSLGDLLVSLLDLLASAAVEEIGCRILLLTALFDLTKSRFNAVFLSSFIFGFIHAPLALFFPVIQGDWQLLLADAQAYAPNFLMQTLLGVVLGITWLRSGSISLIIITHAILNFGPAVIGSS